MTTLGKAIRKEEIYIVVNTSGSFTPNFNVKPMSLELDLMYRYEPVFPEVRNDFKVREIYMKSMARYIFVNSKLGRNSLRIEP